VEIKHLGVMLAFALCGVLSSFITDYDDLHRTQALLVAVPFALLSAVLFMRTLKEIIAAPLTVVVWDFAHGMSYWIVLIGPRGPGEDFIPVCIGGFVGGLGLVLANAIGRRRLLSLPYLIGGGALGCVAALPFGLWLRSSRDRKSVV
jgi:hypothetical protein